MNYYSIDDIMIPVGNFAFVADVTNSEELFKKFYDAEKNLKVDYMDCAHKLRMAFEAFALHEGANARISLDENIGKTIEQIKGDMIQEIKEPASVVNYKNILIELCVGNEMQFSEMLLKYKFVRYINRDEVRRKIKTFIRYLYDFGSENSHENLSKESKYIPNKENCTKAISSFHDFLCIYYGVKKKFNSTLIPIGNYIPVEKSICERMGLMFDNGKYLFVKEREGKIFYFILSSSTENISSAQRRDVETINKLWEDNFEDPANIIRQTESISGSNDDYQFQVYSLPNKPIKLTYDIVSKLTIDDKLDIITGICHGIMTIHDYDPPLYHRNISPDAFYIFKIKGKYKPLLAKFDCIKDTANADFTVFYNVEKKIQNKKTNQFFAPEVINSNMGQGVDWKKADIYSLAKTCLFILTGEMIDNIDDIQQIEQNNVDEEMILILMEMLSENPKMRPELRKLKFCLENQRNFTTYRNYL